MWILKNSSELLQKMNSLHYPKITSIQTFDFSTLYTSIPHQKLKDRIHMLANQTFLYKNGSRRDKHLVVNGDRTFSTNEETSAGKKYDETLICQMIDFLTENIYINPILDGVRAHPILDGGGGQKSPPRLTLPFGL